MELQDPILRERFEQYILSLQRPGLILTKDFLRRYLDLLIPGLIKSPLAPQGFPVSLVDAAKLFDVAPSKFKRLITGREIDWENPKVEFIAGIDYIETNANNFWMTHGCFARASMKLKKAVGGQIRLYYHLVDKGLRDILGSTLATRLHYDPEFMQEKQPPYSTLGEKETSGNYDFRWSKLHHEN